MKTDEKIKVGVVIPTCSPERKPFVEFLEFQLGRQTRSPDAVFWVNFPNKTGRPDLSMRFKLGIELAFQQNCDVVLLMEDDDYYPPTYIENMVNGWLKLARPVLFGHGQSLYYHIVDLKYKKHSNTLPHCSAFCTGVAPGVNYDVCADDHIWFDIALWKVNKGVQFFINPGPVGIKHGVGLCGGRGHLGDHYKQADPGQKVLREWIDDDTAFNFYKSWKK